MTHYPKLFLNKGRILALWVMYCIQPKKKQFKVQIIGILEEILIKNAPVKRSSPPLIWTKSKRTAAFFSENLPLG